MFRKLKFECQEARWKNATPRISKPLLTGCARLRDRRSSAVVRKRGAVFIAGVHRWHHRPMQVPELMMCSGRPWQTMAADHRYRCRNLPWKFKVKNGVSGRLPSVAKVCLPLQLGMYPGVVSSLHSVVEMLSSLLQPPDVFAQLSCSSLPVCCMAWELPCRCEIPHLVTDLITVQSVNDLSLHGEQQPWGGPTQC